MSKLVKFFKECRQELKKVVWPTRDEVVASVKVVVGMTVVVSIMLGLLDWGFTEAFRAVMMH